MKPFILFIYLFFTTTFLFTGCALSADDDSHIYIEKKCISYEEKYLFDFFDDVFNRHYQDVISIKDELTNENLNNLFSVLKQMNSHWLMLNEKSHNACLRYARCKYIQESELKYYNPFRKFTKSKNMCDNERFEFDISRIKIIAFYSEIQQIQLINTK